MPAIDPAVLEKLRTDIGGDETTMRELADAFFRQTPELLDEARRGAAGEPRRLHRAAHTIKSSANTFGAGRLTELARALEADAVAGPVPDADARVQALSDEYARVARELETWLRSGYRR